MSMQSLSIPDQLDRYINSIAVREPEVFRRCRLETATLPNGQMQISPAQGQFLALMIEMIEAKNIIEVGTFTGYSTLWLAYALPKKGQLLACEASEQWTAIARRYWYEANLAHKINLRIAPPVNTLKKLLDRGEEGNFDFVFLDADKQNVDDYYELSLKLLRPGGVVAIDNVLWSGKVANESAKDADTEAIRALNEKIYQDERVSFSLIPVGDGLTLARKRSKGEYMARYH